MLLENTLPDVELRLALLDVNRDCLDFASSGCSHQANQPPEIGSPFPFAP
jgi:hypothetical protein